MKKKKIFYLEIDKEQEESGVDAISFVDAPAIEQDWFTFKKEENYGFKVDEEKRIIHSPIMLAEHPIMRISPNGEEYFVKFSEETIFEMMKKYFKDNKIHNVNENHDKNEIVDDVLLIESFVVGDRIKSTLYPDAKKGSWFGSFYINDKTYWEENVKSGKFQGLSLEGQFTNVETEFSEQKEETQTITPEKELQSEIENILKSDKTDDEMYEEIKQKLS